MSYTKRTLDDLNRTEPSEYAPTLADEIAFAQYQAYCAERGEISEDYPWPSEQEMQDDAEREKEINNAA